MAYSRERYSYVPGDERDPEKIKASLQRVQRGIPQPTTRVDLRDFDVDFLGNHDSGAVVNRALVQLQNAGGGDLTVPISGMVVTDSVIALPATCSLRFDPNFTLRAGTPLAALVQTPGTTAVRDIQIRGGIFDCNDLASIGIDLRYVGHVSVVDTVVNQPGLHGVRVGDTGASGTSFEAMLKGVHVYRPATSLVPANSYGIWFSNGADSVATDCVIVGSQTAIRTDTQQNVLKGCHAWAFSASGWMTTAFDDNGSGNIWIGCYADTPQLYGFRLRKFNTILSACKVYNNNIYGTDNAVIGVQIDQAGPFATILGTHFSASDATHRIAKDVNAASLTNLTVLGSQLTNVVSTVGTIVPTLTAQSGLFSQTTVQANSGGMIANGAAGDTSRGYFVKTNNSTRVRIGTDGGGETGANAGTNFAVRMYDDSGVSIIEAIWLERATGNIQFRGSAYTLGTLKADGAATLVCPVLSHAASSTATSTETNAHIRVDSSAGAVTYTVTSTLPTGWTVSVMKSDAGANAVTISGTACTFSGAASLTTSTHYKGWTIVHTGSGVFDVVAST